ncbi:MAG: DUF421 domain-containing protein [Clostridia bacterium]|nr:DUF421 domain-containing protein [Clostridia bacterium]
MRVMGKRQVGELQPSELVVTILISELASIPIQDLSRPVSNGVIAILMLVILEIVLSAASLKIPCLRRVFVGKPAIIISNGKIDQKMMRKLRITIDDLLEGLRQDGYFEIENISFAIMETNGKISAMPLVKDTPATKSDMDIAAPEKGVPITIISDGKLQNDAFSSGEINEKQVMKYLKSKNLDVSQVFLMTGNKLKEFYVVKRE